MFTILKSTSLVKSFAVLEALAGLGKPAPLAEVTARAAVTKPNGHRILRSLIALGYVRQTPDRAYHLTHKLKHLTMAGRHTAIVETVEPVLRELRDRTGETVNLAVLEGDTVRYLAVYESQHPLRRVAHPGERDPFFATALGRAMVSHLDPVRQSYLLKHATLSARSEMTVTDPAAIREALAQARARGYAVEHDQCDLGVTCIGAPILVEDEPLAAISLSVPTVRCGEDALPGLVEAVCASAALASRLMTERRNHDEA